MEQVSDGSDLVEGTLTALNRLGKLPALLDWLYTSTAVAPLAVTMYVMHQVYDDWLHWQLWNAPRSKTRCTRGQRFRTPDAKSLL